MTEKWWLAGETAHLGARSDVGGCIQSQLRARDSDRRKGMWEFEALLLDMGRSRRKGRSSKETGHSPNQSTWGCESKGFPHCNFSPRSSKESPTPATLPLSFTVPL